MGVSLGMFVRLRVGSLPGSVAGCIHSNQTGIGISVFFMGAGIVVRFCTTSFAPVPGYFLVP